MKVFSTQFYDQITAILDLIFSVIPAFMWGWDFLGTSLTYFLKHIDTRAPKDRIEILIIFCFSRSSYIMLNNKYFKIL